MRDFIAGTIALGLFLFALRLTSTLRFHRQRQRQERNALESDGWVVLAEIPTADGLSLFLSGTTEFRWGGQTIPKEQIRIVRVLINGSPLATYAANRHSSDTSGESGAFADRPEGIAHDRWDVLIQSEADETLVECGRIRERISQELARRVFDTVKEDMETRDYAASLESVPNAGTTTSPLPPRHDH